MIEGEEIAVRYVSCVNQVYCWIPMKGAEAQRAGNEENGAGREDNRPGESMLIIEDGPNSVAKSYFASTT